MRLKPTAGISGVILLLLGTAVAVIRSEETPATSLLRDPTLFPSELFPGLDELDENELLLDALLRRFPDRILNRPPPDPVATAGEPVLGRNNPGVGLVRVRNLGEALPFIAEALQEPVALLDLRYVQADLDQAVSLGALLVHGDQLTFDLVGTYAEASGLAESDRLTVAKEPPSSARSLVIVLINRGTSGPVEAILAELQSRRCILTIGGRTAGQTASYRSIPGFPGWYAISGEIRPVSLGSLVGTGLTPVIKVDTPADDERRTYDAFDPTRPLSALLEPVIEKDRFDEARLIREFPHSGGFPAPSPRPAVRPATDSTDDDAVAPEPEPVDEALRSACHVIEGLRAFGRIPED